MEGIHLCELCILKFGPKEIQPGLQHLQRFKGYTVDVRMQQFRNINRKPMQFIEFTSAKGQRLLAQMHEEVTR
jgi:hypothetical protein